MASFIQQRSVRFWLVVAVLNLFLVAVLDFLMRLKAIFPMAWVNQKFVMLAYSYFAFSIWVSHAIMVLMVMVVFRLRTTDPLPTRYQYTLAANLLTSFGMLICFILQGYGVYAIIFSTLVLIISFVFAGYGWTDINRSTLPPVIK